MRIGVITDIHSNYDALVSVFEEFKKKNVEKVICLGDIIGIGPYSHKCCEFLMKNQDMILSWIRGNHEQYLIDGIPKTHHSIPGGHPTKQIEYDCYSWNHSQLTKEENEFLKTRPLDDMVTIEGIKIVIEHYPYDDNHKHQAYTEHPTFEEIKSLFRCKDADIYLYGHTHIKNIVSSNGISYINPGSVGCPLSTGKALYGILDINDGKYNYSSFEASYDVKKVISDIEKLNYPMNTFMIWRFYDKSYDYND